MTDPTLARIEDDLHAIRDDVARLLAAVERIAAAPSFTADEDAPIEPPRDMAASIARGLAQAAAGQVVELELSEADPDICADCGVPDPLPHMPDCPTDATNQWARRELDPDEYRPCTEGA